jgi:hypothetical protein
MSKETTSFARQLEAVGHILDGRAAPLKEVCVLQAGDGFLVHAFEPAFGREHSSYAPVTIPIEAEEVRAAIDRMAAPAAGKSWWRR